MLLEESKDSGSILLIVEYLNSKLTSINSSQVIKSSELNQIPQHSEEPLMEGEIDKQKLMNENKEFVFAASQLAQLLETALGELKGYREKYGSLY